MKLNFFFLTCFFISANIMQASANLALSRVNIQDAERTRLYIVDPTINKVRENSVRIYKAWFMEALNRIKNGLEHSTAGHWRPTTDKPARIEPLPPVIDAPAASSESGGDGGAGSNRGSSLDPLFGDAVRAEYARLRLPFTLAVTRPDVENALGIFSPLTDLQQNLGFNGWRFVVRKPRAREFHDSAEGWRDIEYDEYFKAGILREIVFLLTGVSEISQYDSLTSEDVSRIMLCLWHELNFINILNNVPKKNKGILDSSFHERSCPRINHSLDRISPKKYEECHKVYFWRYNEDTLKLRAEYVKNVMIQMINILGADHVVLSLARQFHKQKLIEERLFNAQKDRMEGRNTDAHFETVGSAFYHERNLADVVNRALFNLIKEKIRYAMSMYISPIELDDRSFSFPVVDAAAIYAYTPDFMANPKLRRILDAKYVPVG